jgi:dephospho-CoA kinase
VLQVGLTGGIACGKSYVARRLAAAGLPVLDLDVLAHEVMAPGGSAYADVVQAFGPGVLAADGVLDRKALAEVVFADARARARLEALVHPRVREEAARRAAAVRAPLLVTEAALLVEAGMHLRFARLVVVHCPPELQLARLMHRDGLSEEDARARIAAQMPLGEKRRYAHHEVDTSGERADTDRAVTALGEVLRGEAAPSPGPLPVPRSRQAACLGHGPAEGPRGLHPRRVLDELAAASGCDLQRLAGLLDPPHDGPWFRAARAEADDLGPCALAAPLTLWALLRRGEDLAYVRAAAASLARLTHAAPRAAALAGAYASALATLLLDPGALPRLAHEAAEPPPRALPAPDDETAALAPVLAAAARHSLSPAAARAACTSAREGDLAAALVGAAGGAPPPADPVLDRLLDALARAASSPAASP